MKKFETFSREMDLVGGFVPWLRYRVKGLRKSSPEEWIGQIVTSESTQVVQVGSNDGEFDDPLHALLQKNERWRAVFVEPVPELFERLKKNYGDSDRFSFENSAVNAGHRTSLYTIDPAARESLKDFRPWHQAISSFDRDHILRILPEAEPFIKEIEVDGITLSELFDKHGIKQLCILHIDTEGYDYKVLSQLDLDEFEPALILFEHKHLSTGEIEDSIRFLKERYHVFRLKYDMLAVSRSSEMVNQSACFPLFRYRITEP